MLLQGLIKFSCQSLNSQMIQQAAYQIIHSDPKVRIFISHCDAEHTRKRCPQEKSITQIQEVTRLID